MAWKQNKPVKPRKGWGAETEKDYDKNSRRGTKDRTQDGEVFDGTKRFGLFGGSRS